MKICVHSLETFIMGLPLTAMSVPLNGVSAKKCC